MNEMYMVREVDENYNGNLLTLWLPKEKAEEFIQNYSEPLPAGHKLVLEHVSVPDALKEEGQCKVKDIKMMLTDILNEENNNPNA